MDAARVILGVLTLTSSLTACGDAMLVDELMPSTEAIACVVRGQAVEASSLLVTAADGTELLVSVDGVSASVRVPGPDEPTAPARIDVEGVIAFSAWTAQPTYVLAADVETDMVMVRPGVELAWARTSAEGVVGTVTDETTRWGSRIGPVAIPCGALSLDRDDDDWEAPGSELGDGTRWVLSTSPLLAPPDPDESEDDDEGFDFDAEWEDDWDDEEDEEDEEDEIPETRWAINAFESLIESGTREPLYQAEQAVLREAPGAGRPVQLEASHLVFERVEVAGDWMQVHASIGAGDVVGWLPRGDLVPLDFGYGFGTWGTGGGSHCCGGFWTSKTEMIYQGPAQVAYDARLYAKTSTDSAWAKVRSSAPLTVRHVQGSDWVQLMGAPGLVSGCGGLRDAWLERSAVELPEELDAYVPRRVW